MANRSRTSIEVTCPCCGACLTIDPGLGKVLLSQRPATTLHGRELDHAARILERDAARRESLFQQSVADEKLKSELLERKFKQALEKSKDEPPTRPLRDLDLD